MKLYALVLIMLMGALANAAPIGNQKAPKGGTFKIQMDAAPTTLNALSSTDFYASEVQVKVMETLLNKNPETRDW